MLTAEQEEHIIHRDGSRCIVCGSTDSLSVVNIDQSDTQEPSNYALLCRTHRMQVERQILRITGAPGNWLIQELDTLTNQWHIRKATALATPVEAGQLVHTVGNVVPSLYDSLHEKIEHIDTDHLKEIFVELDTGVMSAFKLKCHIAYELTRRANVDINAVAYHWRPYDERLQALADMIQLYSPSYIVDLARVWAKLGSRWQELIGPLPIPPTHIVELCNATKDTERGLKWYHEYVARFHKTPSLERLRAMRAMGFPDINQLPDPNQLIRSCRICVYLARAPKDWRLVLVDEQGREEASVHADKTLYCKKRRLVLRNTKLDLIAESCQYFEQGIRRRYSSRKLPQGYTPPRASSHAEGTYEHHPAGDDGPSMQ